MTPIELWIQALRSGKYTQGCGFLKRGDGYCCLGVACEVYQEHVGGLEVSYNNNVTTFNKSDILLPREVADWLGFDNRSPRLKNGNELAMLNDTGSTFSDIADLIERDQYVTN